MINNLPTPVPLPTDGGSEWRHDTTHLAFDDRILEPYGDDASVTVEGYEPFRIDSQNVSGMKMQSGDVFLAHATDFFDNFQAC